MTDVVRLLQTLTNLAQAAPTATRLTLAVERARQGDPLARDYLRQQGVYDGLDLLHRGAGQAARLALDHAQRAVVDVGAALNGDLVGGTTAPLPAGCR